MLMLCCLKSDADKGEGKGKGSPHVKAGKKGRAKVDNAPGAFGSPVPMSPTSDDDEFHDAEDSLETLADHVGSGDGTALEKSFSAAVRDAASEVTLLEGRASERDTKSVGPESCVIPQHDIPFADPASGKALSWSANKSGEGFRLRGKNYLRDKKKFPSLAPLFDVVQVLALRSDTKTLDIGTLLYDNQVGELIHGCPTVYVANLMLPDYPPPNPVFGKYDRKVGPDGKGQHIIVVASMSHETREILKKSDGDTKKMSPEIALMSSHFNAACDARGLDAPPHANSARHVTKMVCMVAAGAEALPWAVRVAIGQGNGKPFMVNKTGFFTKHGGVFECGVNAHNFGPVATNGLRNCHGYFKKLTLDIGVTLQGNTETELPERLLFAFRAVKPDLDAIKTHVDDIRNLTTGKTGKPWLDWDAVR
jgi:hypothetical protein|tara:strand:- start:12042 stop:13304 length:1263 start_codon:yes stop_codon:yes gene_type:complete|mmetsp:Transcript_1932/g.6688  ORF Transcript_1932/g.6688 Transcript_1932/m.6688 type:complete len:421 (-) Transcript_1932:4177-5439(-)